MIHYLTNNPDLAFTLGMIAMTLIFIACGPIERRLQKRLEIRTARKLDTEYPRIRCEILHGEEVARSVS